MDDTFPGAYVIIVSAARELGKPDAQYGPGQSLS